MEGCELKLNRLTADKKRRKVRWSALSETGQKSDSMFATIIRTAFISFHFYFIFLNYFIYFISDIFFFNQYPDAFKNKVEGVYLKRIHNKITGQAYVLSLLFLHYRQAA